MIAKHPSEWHVDAGLTKWQYLKEVIPDNDELEEAKKQIKNLAWWDDALCSGADFPMFPDVYHLHPVSFIEQLNSIGVSLPIDYDKIYAPKGGVWRKDQLVDHSHYLQEIDVSKPRMHGNSRRAGDANQDVQKEVINTIFLRLRKQIFLIEIFVYC